MQKDNTDFWNKVDKKGPDGCWLWTGAISNRGYGKFKSGCAHRWAWEFSNGEIPPGMCVCHKCDNPPCVNPAHLFLGTMSDNMRDMVNKKRGKGGLTDEERVQVVNLYKTGRCSMSDIAIVYGVSKSCIHRAIHTIGAEIKQQHSLKHAAIYKKIAELYRTEAYSMRDIANRFGISSSVVHRAIHKITERTHE